MSEQIEEQEKDYGGYVTQLATAIERLGPFAYICLAGALVVFLIFVLKVIGAL